MSVRNEKLIENFRTLLNQCCEPNSKMDVDTLRDMDNLLSGLSNFMGNVKSKVGDNLQVKVEAFHKKTIKNYDKKHAGQVLKKGKRK